MVRFLPLRDSRRILPTRPTLLVPLGTPGLTAASGVAGHVIRACQTNDFALIESYATTRKIRTRGGRAKEG
jgi:hypothetical protein